MVYLESNCGNYFVIYNYIPTEDEKRIIVEIFISMVL